MSDGFKVGDTVQLKSGGPLMTVHARDDDNGVPLVSVIWFAGDNTKEKRFVPAELCAVDNHPPLSLEQLVLSSMGLKSECSH